MQRRPNRLAEAASLYLRQHAYQPVDWYPWGEEAFAKAREENKLIFLSIGYSACHWCHVMAHESFDNEEIAQFLNDHFVSIKVDREERPDVDAVYMNVCMALNGSGGWPLSVFLTPTLKPIFAGTYFPPYDRLGRPGFLSLLKQIHALWQRDPQGVLQQSEVMVAELERLLRQEVPAAPHKAAHHELLLRAALEHFDERHGGFGHAPKFPPDTLLTALLSVGVRHRSAPALGMVEKTLEAMAYGGLFDQLEGGFARYCVDDDWTVPHFEKMLYTQGLLMKLYADASIVLHRSDFLRVACETADWVLRAMQSSAGGFFAAMDADSEGEEGRYYVWSRREIEETLGSELAAIAFEFFELPQYGNFEGEWSVLRRTTDLPSLAAKFGLSLDDLQRRIEEIRCTLTCKRRERVPPARDEKIILSWNSLVISGLVRLAQVAGKTEYESAAVKATHFLWDALRPTPGTLYRIFNAGAAQVAAVLEDYAYFIQSLLDLYEHTLDEIYLSRAAELTSEALEQFYDEAEGRLFTTPTHANDLIYRLEDLHDGALPSPSAVLLLSWWRLHAITNSAVDAQRLEKVLRRHENVMSRMPTAAGTTFLLCELQRDPTICELAGERTDGKLRELHSLVNASYIVNKIIRQCSNSDNYAAGAQLRICAGQQCFPPVNTREALQTLLERESLGVISAAQ
jgi:uncharacterized protein YyaL (SSP411 family)